mgnify:CR=1 FL=1
MKRPLNPTSRRKRPCRMPRIAAAILLTALTAIAAPKARADEGMWLPSLIGERIDDMRAKGFRLTAEDIYSVNEASMKDAVVLFNGGCTGELISPEGLLVTNHHCGYGAIQGHSTVEHDYLTHGFWARDRSEELPNEGLWVRRLVRMEEVTDRLAAGETAEKICEEAAEKGRYRTAIEQMYYGNQQFLFVYEQFDDVRLVGAPPSSIGKFGGDTDNWMWPRHTGDFSMFRIYAGKDNRPAEYSTKNVPYRADEYLRISLDGYDEGDFAMIMGFPGSTQRYMTSYEIDRMLTITNPQRIFIRGERQKILAEDMLASDKVRIQYASKYAQSSNYWKNAMGMSRGIERLDVKRKKQEQERAFQQWAEANSVDGKRYDEALGMIRDAIAASNEAYAAQQYLNEALQRSVEIMTPASYVIAAIGKKGKKLEDPEALKERLRGFYKDYNPATDRRVARRMFELVMEHVKELPDVFVAAEGQFDDLDAAVDYLYDNSVFADETRALEFVDRFSRERLDEDPAALLALSVTGKMLELQQAQKEANRNYADGHRLYIEGLMRQYPDRAWAADANFTIRLTYGQVLPYDPADGVTYHYYTTLRGVMEKEDPKNPTEFSVPDKLKELYAAQDFGAYANGRGELPVAFLANLDITGGNSGSPIMNGRGELLGLAFDGNWEAMSGDVAFEPELQRTISVDIRYVLFIIDKFADAGYLVREMTLVRDGKPFAE